MLEAITFWRKAHHLEPAADKHPLFALSTLLVAVAITIADAIGAVIALVSVAIVF